MEPKLPGLAERVAHQTAGHADERYRSPSRRRMIFPQHVTDTRRALHYGRFHTLFASHREEYAAVYRLERPAVRQCTPDITLIA